MAQNIIMPKTGMAIEEGTIARWLKRVGDPVSKGETIAVIETDKTTMDLESDFEGTLIAIVHKDGETVPVTQTIAWIGAPGEVPPSETGAASASTEVRAGGDDAAGDGVKARESAGSPSPRLEGKVHATPAARALASQRGIPLSTIPGSGPGGAVRVRDIERAQAVKATPLARRIAEQEGLDLASLKAAGPSGKIRKADVQAHIQAPAGAGTTHSMSTMRRAIATRMLRSHQQVPSVTLVARADVTELSALRQRLSSHGQKVSYTDFIVRACALALREYPLLNSSLESDSIVLKDRVNIGFAVAVEGGLLVPVIHDADALGVRQISARAKDLAEKARTGALSAADTSDGTFTVTNLGMYGIAEFTPIINVPESAILGVGAIEESVRVVDGNVQQRSIMSLCLTHDHRHIDGAPAAQFLGRVRELLKDGYALLS